MYIERIQALNEKAMNDYRNKITSSLISWKLLENRKSSFGVWAKLFKQGDLVFLTLRLNTQVMDDFFENKVKKDLVDKYSLI